MTWPELAHYVERCRAEFDPAMEACQKADTPEGIAVAQMRLRNLLNMIFSMEHAMRSADERAA